MKRLHILADSVSSPDTAGISVTFHGQQFQRARFALLRSTFSGSPYQIIAGANTFILRENVTDNLVTIPPGTYTLANFATAVQAAIVAVVPAVLNTYVVTSNASTGYITITRTVGAVAWSLRLAAFPRMAAIMGMAAVDNAIGAGPVVSTLPVRLTPVYYYLASDTLGTGMTTTVPDMRRIAMLSNTGGSFQVSTQLEDELLFYELSTGVLRFFLIDEFGTVVTALNNGVLVVQGLVDHN